MFIRGILRFQSNSHILGRRPKTKTSELYLVRNINHHTREVKWRWYLRKQVHGLNRLFAADKHQRQKYTATEKVFKNGE